MIADFDKDNKRPLLSHRLAARATALRTWLCVGLDPQTSRLPEGIPRNAAGVESFCLSVIDATRGLVLAYKLNFGFFEALGPVGWHVLERVRSALPDDAITIADAKRGDIGPTSQAYAHAIFDELRFDAVTVSPYLGWEALEPFRDRAGTMSFVLCRTSNPGAGVYQDRMIDGDPLYLHIARDAARQEARGELGLVVGATQPNALIAVRREFPDIPLLVPGVGAQGAAASEVMPLVRSHAIIPVSRQILYASSGTDFQRATADATAQLASQCWSPHGA